MAWKRLLAGVEPGVPRLFVKLSGRQGDYFFLDPGFAFALVDLALVFLPALQPQVLHILHPFGLGTQFLCRRQKPSFFAASILIVRERQINVDFFGLRAFVVSRGVSRYENGFSGFWLQRFCIVYFIHGEECGADAPIICLAGVRAGLEIVFAGRN